jgi:aspartyl aminopeptidase
VNQSYATDGPSQGAFVEACRAEGTEAQYFSARNDMPCGSTIGPISAARLGLRTVDVGNPMLSMHSCREMAGTNDAATLTRVLRRLLREPPPNDPGL